MPTDQILNRGQRIAWLDNVKMFAMLCVILGHVMTIVIKTLRENNRAFYCSI